MKPLFMVITFALMTIVIVGCTVANYVVPAYTSLNFNISSDVNPDLNGRPSPIVVKVYELSSRTLFDNQDFFSLYDDPKYVLGPDLIEKNEFEFSPKSQYEYKLKLSPGVRYAGIIVAYQDIENARWREVVNIDTTAYKTYNVMIGESSVFIDSH
ncbi:type VI secretion system lipoprotein TssJ [Photobacterium makurazakiensis]|uniref:type VI secretion system lipoprotein TssJ n=1 Tax=Photobacterium makurazakiensis TaxID=2910234 RepID=UPI003D0FBAB1